MHIAREGAFSADNPEKYRISIEIMTGTRTNTAVRTPGRVLAVLGPTNTGKTYTAIERMLTHHSGVIGFPLRLLARENYDRIVERKGVHAVALVTGEEKIIPPHARYYVCTVESMPVDQKFDFLAVDEIQLCGDPERGFIFTDRLLRSRGIVETMFMGAETIRPLMQALIPNIEFESRARLSQLTYRGYKKLTRLPKRTAVVAFSVDDVYANADLIRRHRGGTAVVLGALSPRTRNKQVDMYQSGEVDFLVATDAIGMGLNMDIHHVALAATRKFDGAHIRSLDKAEIAQIAGRAGRHVRDGTFGVTGPVPGLDPDMVEAIEHHIFDPLPFIYWRNADLDFSTIPNLLRSLEVGSGSSLLQRGRPADDYAALAHLAQREGILQAVQGPEMIQLLWEVCQIPDFRKTLSESHQAFVEQVFLHLKGRGTLPEDWVETHISRLDRVDGEVDSLMTRIAHIRTWTYITHKSEWLQKAAPWQARTLAIEDRLSDALHDCLTQRFVDRRSAVLMRSLESGGPLLAGVRGDGSVVVEGHEVGHLQAFRFIPDEAAGGSDRKAVMTAARSALKPEIERRLKIMLNSVPKQFRLTDDGQIFWQKDATNPLPGEAVARVRKGASLMKPDVDVIDSDLLQGQDKAAVADHIRGWLQNHHIATVLEPLKALEAEDDKITPAVRGIAWQVYEGLGIVPRAQVEELIGTLTPEDRAALRARKIRLGPVLVFLPALNKPAAVRLRALLWSLWHDKSLPADVPNDGMVSKIIDEAAIDPVYFRSIGYPVYGGRVIRVDMLDRLISAIYDNAVKGEFQAKHEMAEWLGCSIPDLYKVLESMGHKKVEDKPVAVEASAETPAVPDAPVAEVTAESLIAEVKADDATEAKAEEGKVEAAAKPVLATFRLKRGKANESRPPRREHNREHHEKRPHGDRKPGGEKKFGDKKHGDRKPFNKGKGGKPEPRERKEYVISAEAKTKADSPFAILQQLKSGDGK